MHSPDASRPSIPWMLIQFPIGVVVFGDKMENGDLWRADESVCPLWLAGLFGNRDDDDKMSQQALTVSHRSPLATG